MNYPTYFLTSTRHGFTNPGWYFCDDSGKSIIGPFVTADAALKAQQEPSNTLQIHNSVNHPSYYTSHPSGIECITIIEHMGFNLGNAIKYIWRADLKGNSLEDLKKSLWYIQREIAKREKCPS